MAEIAASILGIATFGIQLTHTLYDFGTTTSTAKDQTDYIARHVSLYASVLDLLADRIEDGAPLISKKGFDIVEDLADESYDLFHKIRDLLPGRGKDELSFFEKIKWNFKKSKVELLVGELNHLKSTVHLLVTILFVGKKLKSYNKRKRQFTKDKLQTERDDISHQCMKAENAILEHIDAGDKLPGLQAEAENATAGAIEQKQPIQASAPQAVELVSRQNNAIANFQQSLVSLRNPSGRRAYVLDNSGRLLHDLILQWTTVDVEGASTTEPDIVAQAAQNEETEPEESANADSRRELPRRRDVHSLYHGPTVSKRDSKAYRDAAEDRLGIQSSRQPSTPPMKRSVSLSYPDVRGPSGSSNKENKPNRVGSASPHDRQRRYQVDEKPSSGQPKQPTASGIQRPMPTVEDASDEDIKYTPQYKPRPATSRALADGSRSQPRPQATVAATDTRFTPHVAFHLGAVADPSEFREGNDYRAACIKADNNGQYPIDHRSFRQIVQDYQKEPSRKPKYSTIRYDSSSDGNDNAATVDPTEDGFRAAELKCE